MADGVGVPATTAAMGASGPAAVQLNAPENALSLPAAVSAPATGTAGASSESAAAAPPSARAGTNAAPTAAPPSAPGTSAYELLGDRELFVQHVFASDARFLFDAWTRVEHLARWMGPLQHRLRSFDTDLRVGGTYRLAWQHDDNPDAVFTIQGNYKEVDAPRRLVVTEALGDSGSESLLTIDFAEQAPDRTLVRIRVHYPSPEIRSENLAAGVKAGMEAGYSRLDSLIGSRKASTATAAAAAAAPSEATAAAPPSQPPTGAFASLPSESALRSAIRSLLLTADLYSLTPKLVRAHIGQTLHVSEDIMDGPLKKDVKRFTAEEMEKVQQERAPAAAEQSSPSKGASKGKKNKHAEKEQASPSKRQKKADGSAAKSKSEAADEDGMEDGVNGAEEEDGAGEDETQEDADARMAAELAEEDARPRRAVAAASAKAVKKSAPRDRKPPNPNGPKRPAPLAALSPQLTEFLGDGTTELARGEVTKRVWAYVREHELQDPADKRKIRLDDTLKKIFGEKLKTLTMFKLTQHLAKHMKNKDLLTG